MLYLTEAEVESLVSMPDALEAVEQCFRALGEGHAQNRPRQRVTAPRFGHNLMLADWQARGYSGYKTYTSGAKGTRFWFHLFDAHTGDWLAVMEADRLGQRRTGAASGVATKFLARENANTLGIVGAGWQAESQLEAICRVRTLRAIKCYCRNDVRAQTFAQKMSARLGVPIHAVASAEQAVRDSDIVVTATSASEPVMLGEWLKPGAHVNLIGANSMSRREADETTLTRSAKIFADSVEQAKIESGDLTAPVQKNLLTWEQVQEFASLVVGKVRGREREDEITLFKSHGIALEDVAVGALAYERAKERAVGREINV